MRKSMGCKESAAYDELQCIDLSSSIAAGARQDSMVKAAQFGIRKV